MFLDRGGRARERSCGSSLFVAPGSTRKRHRLRLRSPRRGTTRERNFRLAKSLCWKSCVRGRRPMADKLKAKDKVDHPEAQFDKPKEVVQDKTLSRHEQKKALNTWEQDERQLLTASNEGMAGRKEGLESDHGNRLDEVVRTKEKIGEKPKHKPSH